LPTLFEDRGCIVVYATTEPLDALMIGGNTATLLEGSVIQYGKTLDVYNKPENLTSAKVFSDPPMNIAEINKSGGIFKLNNNNVQWTQTQLLCLSGEGGGRFKAPKSKSAFMKPVNYC
jgi:glycerol transport system ATP-binding protein